MPDEHLIEVERDGHVGVIRLVDERNRNALSTPFRTALVSAFAELEADPDVRAIYLTGRGKAFCGGGDLRMMEHESDPWSAHLRLQQSGRWIQSFLRFAKPIVVGVNGVVVGGGLGIALIGDVVYAGERDAKFMAGFLRLGLIPDLSVMYVLPRLVGMARARAFVLGNETWDAAGAESYGLIAGAIPDDELEARCLARAHELAAAPVEAIGLIKQLMGRTFESSLDEMLVFEDLGQSLAYATAAMREGLSALRSGSPADFVAASEREPARQLLRQRASAPESDA